MRPSTLPIPREQAGGDLNRNFEILWSNLLASIFTVVLGVEDDYRFVHHKLACRRHLFRIDPGTNIRQTMLRVS